MSDFKFNCGCVETCYRGCCWNYCDDHDLRRIKCPACHEQTRYSRRLAKSILREYFDEERYKLDALMALASEGDKYPGLLMGHKGWCSAKDFVPKQEAKA